MNQIQKKQQKKFHQLTQINKIILTKDLNQSTQETMTKRLFLISTRSSIKISLK